MSACQDFPKQLLPLQALAMVGHHHGDDSTPLRCLRHLERLLTALNGLHEAQLHVQSASLQGEWEAVWYTVNQDTVALEEG